MSDASPSMLVRFLALPRALQWALLATIGVGLFLVWDSWIAPLKDDLDKKSSLIEAQVREIRGGRELVDALNKADLKNVVIGVGTVKPPRNASSGTRNVFDVVNALMKKHGITDQDFSLRARGKLQKNALVQVLNGKRGEKLAGELKFSAKPEVALAILSELEASPDIEQVMNVRLTKDQAGKIKVQYTIEAWVIASDSGTTGTGVSL